VVSATSHRFEDPLDREFSRPRPTAARAYSRLLFRFSDFGFWVNLLKRRLILPKKSLDPRELPFDGVAQLRMRGVVVEDRGLRLCINHETIVADVLQRVRFHAIGVVRKIG